MLRFNANKMRAVSTLDEILFSLISSLSFINVMAKFAAFTILERLF